ncbi:MAG: 4-alpha-glucanotransferase [Cyanobacteriota bacterium]|nr:4-alpha-glucanotransferase [Cyanobacteriota bacterium]
MLVSKISNSNRTTVLFERKLRKDEEQDYRENALQPAFDYLGTEEVAMIVHGTSYPEKAQDLGVGSPYGKAAAKFIPFEILHGFNSNQLGPIGVIRDAQHISPYKSTVSTRNYLFTDLNDLTTDKYANVLSQSDIDSMIDYTDDNGKDYAYSDFPEAFSNYKYLMKIANKNFKQKLANNDPMAQKLNEEFVQFKKEKGVDIYQDALFDVLTNEYKTMDFNKWSELDKNLIQELKNQNPKAIDRYKKITTRSKDDFETYIFGQFILDKQIKENTKLRKDLNFKYISDLLVGFSKSDEWSHQDLFLKNWRMGCPNGGEYGPQLWNIPVLDPKKLFNDDGSLGDAGLYMKKKLDASLDNFENVRIDHALGLIDPYIYDKNSVNGNDFSHFRANNISYMPDIDPDGSYKKVLNKIILPTLAEHGIDKDYPVWEDLCTDTQTFNEIYHEKNHLPGITQLEYMRAENSQDDGDWGLVGSHDSDPATKMIKKDWVKDHDAWNIFYLAGFLNSNPKRAKYRDSFCKQIAENDSDRIKAKFAELFLTCKKIQISFADFFGIDKTYNEGGKENDTNWKLRLNKDYEDSYYKNLSSERPTALNMPEILKIAVQAKADMNALKEAQRTGKEPQENNSPEVENILNNLDKYEKILKE